MTSVMKEGNRAIAVIPARGGSKRIPQKNIAQFNGKPMIEWTISAAFKSGCFSSVYVSTDCPKIADVAKNCGAKVPFLRTEYADDFCTVAEATRWFLRNLLDQEPSEDESFESDVIVQLMANCPIRRSETIIEFLEYFHSDTRCSNLVSVMEPKFGNPFWAIEQRGERGKFIFDGFMGRRSQDLPKAYMPTGSIWISRFSDLLEQGSFYGDEFRIKEISWVEGIDIDTQDELLIAEKLHSSFIHSNPGLY